MRRLVENSPESIVFRTPACLQSRDSNEKFRWRAGSKEQLWQRWGKVGVALALMLLQE